MYSDSTNNVGAIHTKPVPPNITIKVMEGDGQIITGAGLYDAIDGGNLLVKTNLAPVKPPAGITNITITSGNLILMEDNTGLRMVVLKPLDIQLMEEAQEEYDAARAADYTTVGGANRTRRKMAATVLCLQAALHARAFRIVAERYGEPVEVLKTVDFAGMWHKLKNHIAKDHHVTIQGQRWKGVVADVLKLYNHRHLIAHYTNAQAFDADMAELQRLIEYGFNLFQATDPLIVSLMTPEDEATPLPENETG